MSRLAELVGTVLFVALSVISLTLALGVMLGVAVGAGFVLFRRAIKLDEAFAEIIRGQEHTKRQMAAPSR